MTQPRIDRLCWGDHHMLVAVVTAQRSPDPSTQVGACIVGPDNKILSTGYNGPPRGVAPEQMPWDRHGDPLETKYPYVIHAEANAILNSNFNLEGSSLYVTMYPCNECAKLVCASRIKEVFYLKNPYKDTWQSQASKYLMETAQIKVTEFTWNKDRQSILSTLTHFI